jgi:peptidoglycan/xylan/chitin deacetylase (PgdA/CDA1 family)
MGVELAVHGHDHVDFRTLAPTEARRQLERAGVAFDRNGITYEGFRCPYLSCTGHLTGIVPRGMFQYSSNDAIKWDFMSQSPGGATYAQLDEFYGGTCASKTLSLPRFKNDLIELPVSLPDDLQLIDGMGLPAEEIKEVWLEILAKTHRRGELFAPLFHPESFDLIWPAVEAVVRRAQALDPSVWIAQLGEVARWWRERSLFGARMSDEGRGLRVDLDCSLCATVLARDWPDQRAAIAWDGRYCIIAERTLWLDSALRPFVGLGRVGEQTTHFLSEQGYVLDLSPRARSCTVYIAGEEGLATKTEIELLEQIESTAGPLLKFSRWPHGAKSVLCLAGDLDALSLRDYASRLMNR